MAMTNAGGVDDHGLNPVGATGACGEKPMPEMTAGQRIAERWMLGYDFRADIAAAIDEAIRSAQRDAGLQALREAHETLDELGAPTVSNDPDPDEFGTIAFLEERIKMALAAAREQTAREQDARITDLIARLEPGDLPHLAPGKAMSAALQGFADRARQAGYMEGCVVERNVVDENRALREQIAAKEAEAAAMREALTAVKQILDSGYEPTYQQARIEGMLGIVNAALASNAGEALLARLRMLESRVVSVTWGQLYDAYPEVAKRIESHEWDNKNTLEQQEWLLVQMHELETALAFERGENDQDCGGVRSRLSAAQCKNEELLARLRAAEEQAAALEAALKLIASEYPRTQNYTECGGCNYLSSVATKALAAVQAARAKEPGDTHPINDVCCSSCGEMRDNADLRWRWNGSAWEHKCGDPQAGYFSARNFGPAKEPPDA